MTLLGECRGWDMETVMLSQWREHRDLFPVQPSQSRFNRRRRQLMHSVNLLRQQVLARLDIALDAQCVIDSLPVPVMGFHLVPSSSGDWPPMALILASALPRKSRCLATNCMC